ncbi:hypothetical protein [Flavobacterium sp.]|uniref:hypothetical protein n=1 Tax=Flavobacterium sp. TaxID=239 RepID=UPI0012011954|nr:hypothetical protein [Flavobacterium sp.]RZJ70611.1 MAG: hypothetical protein EOO49_13360 [Flavobacterium sp.]
MRTVLCETSDPNSEEDDDQTYEQEPKPNREEIPEIEIDEEEPMISYRISDDHCSQSEEDFWRGI